MIESFDSKYPIGLAIIVAVILSMIVVPSPALAQTDNTTQDIQDELDDLQNELEDATNSSSDENATQNQSENETQNQTQQGIDEVNHEFLFSDIQVEVIDKSINQFIVRVKNPTNQSRTLVMDGIDGQKSRDSVVFDAGEVQTVNLTPYSPIGIYGTATISEFAPRDEVVGQNRDLNDTVFLIEYYLIQPVTQPPVPHNIIIVFLGGFSFGLMILAGYLFNARPTRIAKPLNRDDISITSYVDSPDYSYTADDPAMVKLVKFSLDWLKAWGMIVVNFTIGFWGMYRFLGGSVSGTYNLDFYFFAFDMVIPQLLEDSMVYMLYGELMFWMMFFVGMHIARQRWIELSDVRPKQGDNYLYKLTPSRFRDMTVLAEVKKPQKENKRKQTGTITYEVPSDWIFEINKETKGDSYECYDYDIHENICKVSWSGELKKLNPSQLRKSKNTIDYVMETSMWAIERYQKFLDFYSHDVLMEARYLMSRQTAIRQDADLEGLGGADDRVEQRMESRGEADALSGDELAVAQDLQDTDAEFDLVEKKQQARSDTKIIDYEPESDGSESEE